METLSTTKEAKDLDAKRFIAEEVNLSRLPFFASSTKGLKKKIKIEYHHTAEINGREVKALWKVSANAEYGYPGPLAEAIHAAILQIIAERGFPIQHPITFTFYDICKRLDLEPSGRTRQRIRKAIFSIRGALIEIQQSFVTKDGRRLSFTDSPNLYSRVIFYGDEDPETGEPIDYSAVWLADFYLNSLNSGYVRPLDFEYFKQLRKVSFVSTKLYRYLGYRFAGCFRHNNEYSRVDYDDLAIIADVKRQPFLSAAKRSLAAAHNIFTETGFLSRDPVWQVEDKKHGQPTKFYILYYPGKRAREEYKRGLRLLTRQLDIPFEPAVSKAAAELSALGVSEQRALKIAQQHTPKEINLQLDHLAHLGEIGRPITDNVGGWLADAVEKGYTPPKGFITRAEREARHKAHAEVEEQQRQREEEDQKQRAEHNARYQELDIQLAALPEADQQRIRQEIEMRIRGGFDDFMRRRYATKPFDPQSPIHRKEYYQHLADLLNPETP